MTTAWSVTTAPASEPVSTADAKTYLNVTHSIHDTLIANQVSAARAWYEGYTGTAVITQSITQIWDYTPENACFELSVGPVTGTPVVSYKDTAGAYQTWASSNYTLDTVSDPARIVKISTSGWPTIGYFPAVWKIVYSAGYASAATVPEDTINAILMMTAFFYENREDLPINSVFFRSAERLAFQRKRLMF